MLCVYCRTRPVDPAWRPFCSERCKLLDLANWVDGRYTAPSDEAVTDEDAGSHEHARSHESAGRRDDGGGRENDS
ncbi:MAG: DNA gyrase inhibitor YacG [Acidobacteria bacterium]|nr:DNA gyrase inhibitor YacG [Acidobacteriota bacterium]